jgi:hypothetical protein
MENRNRSCTEDWDGLPILAKMEWRDISVLDTRLGQVAEPVVSRLR